MANRYLLIYKLLLNSYNITNYKIGSSVTLIVVGVVPGNILMSPSVVFTPPLRAIISPQESVLDTGNLLLSFFVVFISI